MNSFESLAERNLETKGVLGFVTNDTPVAIRLKFVGNGTATITSVTVNTSTDITIDWSAGSDTVYDFATYTTIGALVDKINTDGFFEAKVLDSLRADATVSAFVDGAVSVSYQDGFPFYDINTDVNAKFQMAYRISPNRKMLPGDNFDNHRTHLLEFIYYANVENTPDADSVQVWDCFGATETKLFSTTSVDATKTTVNFNSGDLIRLSSLGEGHELVVLVKDSVSLANGGYLKVVGEIE